MLRFLSFRNIPKNVYRMAYQPLSLRVNLEKPTVLIVTQNRPFFVCASPLLSQTLDYFVLVGFLNRKWCNMKWQRSPLPPPVHTHTCTHTLAAGPQSLTCLVSFLGVTDGPRARRGWLGKHTHIITHTRVHIHTHKHRVRSSRQQGESTLSACCGRATVIEYEKIYHEYLNIRINTMKIWGL